jgi:hypothetical protein
MLCNPAAVLVFTEVVIGFGTESMAGFYAQEETFVLRQVRR